MHTTINQKMNTIQQLILVQGDELIEKVDQVFRADSEGSQMMEVMLDHLGESMKEAYTIGLFDGKDICR